MKKRTPKVVLTSLMLILTLSVMALLTGCGGTPTLEEYINDNPKEQEAMDSELDKANVTQMCIRDRHHLVLSSHILRCICPYLPHNYLLQKEHQLHF